MTKKQAQNKLAAAIKTARVIGRGGYTDARVARIKTLIAFIEAGE